MVHFAFWAIWATWTNNQRRERGNKMKKTLLVLISALTLCACEEPSYYSETPECKVFKNFTNIKVCSMPDGVVCYVAYIYKGGGISCIKAEQKD